MNALDFINLAPAINSLLLNEKLLLRGNTIRTALARSGIRLLIEDDLITITDEGRRSADRPHHTQPGNSLTLPLA